MINHPDNIQERKRIFAKMTSKKKVLFTTFGMVSVGGATPSFSSDATTPLSSPSYGNKSLLGPHQTVHAPSNHAFHRKIADISQIELGLGEHSTISTREKRERLQGYLKEHGHVYETTLVVPKNAYESSLSTAYKTHNSDRQLQGASMSAFGAQVWAIRNGEVLPQGWRVAELQFFEDEGCRKPREEKKLRYGPTFGVGEKPPKPGNQCANIEYGPSKAFDGFGNTFWVSKCCPCAELEAHIGADFGNPVVVQCVKIWQSLAPFYSSIVTLSKEGTTTAGLQNDLWVDVVTWTGLNDMLNTRVSGIETGMTSITFKQNKNRECSGFIYGNKFGDRTSAENSCRSDPRCGAVYEQSCSMLVYNVTISNPDDLRKIQGILKRVTEKKTDNQGTEYLLSYDKTINAGTTYLSNNDGILTNSRLIDFRNYPPPMDNIQIIKDEYPNGIPMIMKRNMTFPYKIKFEVKPLYGAIFTCLKEEDQSYGFSNEESCVWIKEGALLNYDVKWLTEVKNQDRIIDQTIIANGMKLLSETAEGSGNTGITGTTTSESMGISGSMEESGSVLPVSQWISSPADCAQECLDYKSKMEILKTNAANGIGLSIAQLFDQPPQCDGFLWVIMKGGQKVNTCKLLYLPDKGDNYFDISTELYPTDGTLEIVDFYIRQDWYLNSTHQTTQQYSRTQTSGTTRGATHSIYLMQFISSTVIERILGFIFLFIIYLT